MVVSLVAACTSVTAFKRACRSWICLFADSIAAGDCKHKSHGIIT